MAVPTNQTAATAIAMTLPYTATQIDIDLATPTPQCDVWYSYTATADGVVGMLVRNPGSILNYYANLTVWVGPVGSLALYLGGFFALQWPIQHPVTAGTTYYYRVRNHWIFTPSPNTSIDVSFLPAPANPLSVGSILINDDTTGFPAAILSATTGLVTSFVVGTAVGEGGDVLPTGEILLENRYFTPPSVSLYTSSVVFVQEIDYGGVVPSNPFIFPTIIRTHNPSNMWYVGSAGSTAPLVNAFATTVNADGTLGPTTWTFAAEGLTGLAANNAETILYYTGQGATFEPVASPLQRWDLVNNLPLSNLAAGVADYWTYDTMVLADDTILQTYVHSSLTDAFVRRYNAAGAILNTYTLPLISERTAPRLAYAIDTSTFWLMWLADDATPGLGIIQNIRIADGVALTTLRSYIYQGGEFSDWNPVGDRFGRSQSCPFLILRGTSPEPAMIERYHTRRRVRTFPHLSSEQINAFHRSLQIDMETGVGLGNPDEPHNDNPQVMLDWSDNGGHTWSNVHAQTLGKIGQRKHRVFYRMLGKSRDRIYRLTLSDCVRAYVVAAYLDAVEGVN